MNRSESGAVTRWKQITERDDNGRVSKTVSGNESKPEPNLDTTRACIVKHASNNAL